MKGWICDANINEATIIKFEKSIGIEPLSIVKYYGIDYSLEDDEIIALAKRENKTLITGDYNDFNSKSNVQYVNSPGIWIFKTYDSDKQVKLLRKAIVGGKFQTLASRRNKKVYMKSDETIVITDVKTGIVTKIK